MDQFFAYIAGTFTSPRSTLAKIAARRPLVSAIIVFILTGLVSALSGFSNIPAQMPFNAAMLAPAAIIGTLIFGTFFWFIQTGVYHLFAEFFGGEGSVLSLFTTLPFTSLPSLVLTPIGMLMQAARLGVLMVPVSLGMFIWMVVLQVLALKEVYGISGGRATAVIFLPVVLIGASLIILGITLAGTLIPIITELAPQLPLEF